MSRYSHLVVIAGCALVAAFTLIKADVFISTPWPETLRSQTLLLFGMVGVMTTALALASRIVRLRLELLIAALAVVLVTVFCGPAATATVAYFLISALCLARLLLAPLGSLDEVPLNLQIAFGWAGYGVGFALLAAVRMHWPAVHAAILAAPIVLVAAIPASRIALGVQLRRVFVLAKPDNTGATLYVAGLVACVTVMSFHLAEVALPERYYDALVMHLYVPSYIAGHNAWSYDVTNHVFAYMPMTVDFLYTHMFLLQGEQAARLLNFVAFVLTCVAVFQIAARSASRVAAIWSVALLVSIPLTLIESASLFIEHSVALFIISAALAVVATRFRISLLTHAIVMVTLAAATSSKLHGAVGALLLGCTSAVLYLRERRPVRELAAFAGVTVGAAAVALWPYLLAWHDTGNPVFPFMNLVFKSPYWRSLNFSDDRWNGNLSPAILFDATFHTSRFAECTDGAFGYTLFVFLPAAVLAAVMRRNRTVLFSLGVGFAAITVLALQSQYLRYFYIFMPLLMVGVALALDAPGRWRIPAAVLALAVTVLNVMQLPSAGWIIAPSDFRAIYDADARQKLVLDQAPERVANETVNALAGPTSKVIYFANPFSALLTGTATYDNWYNTTYWREHSEIASEEDVARLVRLLEPSHVIFDTAKVQEPGQEKRYSAVADYLSHKATLVGQVGRLSIYQTATATP